MNLLFCPLLYSIILLHAMKIELTEIITLLKSEEFLDQMDAGMDISFLNKYDKLIMELGCGDGRLLYGLANKDMRSNAFYLGIELDVSQYKRCCLLLSS